MPGFFFGRKNTRIIVGTTNQDDLIQTLCELYISKLAPMPESELNAIKKALTVEAVKTRAAAQYDRNLYAAHDHHYKEVMLQLADEAVSQLRKKRGTESGSAFSNPEDDCYKPWVLPAE